MTKGNVAWSYGTEVEGKNKVKCNYCDKIVSGITRLKHHLLGTSKDVKRCFQVPEEIKEELKQRLNAEAGGGVVRSSEAESAGPAAGATVVPPAGESSSHSGTNVARAFDWEQYVEKKNKIIARKMARRRQAAQDDHDEDEDEDQDQE